MNLEHAIVYDEETFPNCSTLAVEALNSDFKAVWEISHFRDDRMQLFEFLDHLMRHQIAMIGFNNIHFDYPVLHFIMSNRNCTVEQIYAKSQEIINSGGDKFGHVIWAKDRYIPQIDLFKIYHMDNRAKSTTLKYLQINMRSPSVVDMPIPHGTILTKEQIDTMIVPYNQHDVQETKRFALTSLDAINFRISLIDQFGLEVLNWNDTKIGEETIVRRLGDDVCYDYSTGRKRKRQTPRTQIALNDIIFPYISFQHPEFQRVHNYLRAQVLKSDELGGVGEEGGAIKTKGVFTDLKASVGGIDFCFGVGGIHGSLERARVASTDELLIRDIDVASLYPSIAIVNKLSPEHLGSRFTEVYAQLPAERKEWQKKKGKKCVEANGLKLASNGAYGKSNSMYSVLYDPKFTMSITVNGQLLLCMLAERLLTVPTIRLLMINTDGITYFIQKSYLEQARAVEEEWEKFTCLTLESVFYKRMWIRDVNNYVAESKDGSLKLKGCYSTPDPLNHAKSIGEMQPPGWHRDWSAVIVPRAAVAHMVHGVDIEQYIRFCTNPYDFMLGIKVRKSDVLMWNGQKQQYSTRYYVSTDGAAMTKEAPAAGPPGQFKMANGVNEAEYKRIMKENGWQWDERVCTKNKSRYEQRTNQVQAGYKVSICNDVRDFRFDNLNYTWYVQEAIKLVI